ncbi:citramalate synthase [Jannaschia sp. Os4]|uniref:citramalate synthase n=1 Tax=Jannaschia sp. Os4 TaxID=2807617 RepID=UPI0031B63846
MQKARLSLFDTTLRDGQQTHGVHFTAGEKHEIAHLLDRLGFDYVEGGWPGANGTDSAFFEAPPKLARATFTAFGMTKRAGRSAANDETLAAVVNAGTPAICLVGKAHPFHVTHALGTTLAENRAAIADSVAHCAGLGRETLFDAEHFFDGYADDPAYATDCLAAALDAGARWAVLCDTNGGTMPERIGEVVEQLIAAGLPGERLGIHTHDDTGQAVAGSLAAVRAGARQIQGTLNGLGERCGNANLTTLVPTLLLKADYAGFETGIDRDALPGLMAASRRLDDILDRTPRREAPYVGASAFAHKAGLHASAILKDPATYEHVPPEAVGNARIIPMSKQAGRANLRRRLQEMGLEATDAQLGGILAEVKEREDRGYEYDRAQASFELIALRHLGLLRDRFEVDRYRVTVERRRDRKGEMTTLSEAVVSVIVDGERRTSVSESRDPEGADMGPVNALAKALVRDLGSLQDRIAAMELTDFRVRITGAGTDAVTRVVIDHADGDLRWSTVGAGPNIVDASFEALLDAIRWKLWRS